MKKKTLVLFSLSIVLTSLVTLLGIRFNKSMPVLGNNALLDEKAAALSAPLTDWRYADGRYSFTLRLADPDASYSLYIMNAAYEIPLLVNGEPLPANGLSGHRIYTLPFQAEGLYEITSADRSVTAAIVGESSAIFRAMGLYETFQNVSTSVTLCVSVYIFILYLFKREESYLGYVCLYVFTLAVWLPLLYSWRIPAIDPQIYTTLFWIGMSLVILKVCVSITKIHLSARLERLLRWRYLFLFGVLLFFPCYFFRNTLVELSILLLLSALSILVLVLGVAEGVPFAWVLLAGKILVSGLHALVLVYFLPGMGTTSLPQRLMTSCRIYDFPFMFSCILFINRKFAKNFSDSVTRSRELDALVQDRTKALLEQQSARQSMMLNIFHDLRTPLFVTGNCIGLLKDDPAQVQKLLPIMEERHHFVCELTEDLFLAVKLEEKQILLDYQAVDMYPLLTALCRTFSPAATGKNLSLSVTLEEGLRVWGDQVRLRQIFQNLLVNACYYSPAEGQVVVEMRREGDMARIKVQDFGKGIAAEELPHIFERYFHTSEENKHDSTGLGLTIAHDLTELHRGFIQVESEPGAGTTFIVFLPLLS